MNPASKIAITITRQLLFVVMVCAALAFVAKAMLAPPAAGAGSSFTQERSLSVKEFKGMPIAVREVRNLEHDTWYDDLEIEVKNVSNKPVYLIFAQLSLPDTAAGGGRYGIPLVYGGDKNIWDRAKPEDPHIDPGEVYVFTIPDDLRGGFKRHQASSPWMVKRLELNFPLISFGDGTGFEARRFVDYRNGRPR